MKIKHHSVFNELSTNTIDWSIIRSNKKEKGYYLPDNLDIYLKDRKSEKNMKGLLKK